MFCSCAQKKATFYNSMRCLYGRSFVFLPDFQISTVAQILFQKTGSIYFSTQCSVIHWGNTQALNLLGDLFQQESTIMIVHESAYTLRLQLLRKCFLIQILINSTLSSLY